jgi:hypothetical protein
MTSLYRSVGKTSDLIFSVSRLLDLSMDFRYIVRDFVYSEDVLEKQRLELATADTTERELWVSAYKNSAHDDSNISSF